MAEEKKYIGYGYHGGGRKATGIKRVFYIFFVFCIDTKQKRVYIITIRQERKPARR